MALFHILLAPLPFSLLTAVLNLFLCVRVCVCVIFWWGFFSVWFFFSLPPNCNFAVFSNHLSGPSGVVIFGGASLERKHCSLSKLSCGWDPRLVGSHLENYR